MPRSDTSWQKEYARLAVEISQETGYELPERIYELAGEVPPTSHHWTQRVKRIFRLHT